MDWANVTKMHTPPSAKRYFPPWWVCAVEIQFRDREYILAPRGRARFGADQKERGLWWREGRQWANYRKSLLASHSVMEMCRSCFINTKYKCLGCELLTCNKCSVFKQNGEDVEG